MLTSHTMESIQNGKTAKTDKRNFKHIADKKEILFNGYFYDITDFIEKHPGGNVIYYYTKTGEDATHAIEQFHHRSIKQVKAMINSLKRRPALDSESNCSIFDFE